MSSRRRRGSKWDLTRDITPEKFHDNGRSSKAGSSFHEHESREYLSGRRGYHRNEHVNEETMPAWDGVGRHDTSRMSPGLDGWRRRTRSRSPRSSRGRSLRSRSRSRSHSPAHNPRREPVFSDRNNGWESRQTGPLRHASFDYHSNDRRSAPVCNNFLAGRCRKGSLCKYAHHDAGSSEFGKELMDEVHKDGYGDWRGKGGRSYDSDREPHKGNETICRYFVAGNCRNGKHCKFSHHQEELHHHERRSLGERRIDNGRNDMDEVWNTSLKWTNNTDPPSSGGREAHLREEDRCKAMDSAKLRDMDQSNYDYVDQELTDQNHPRHVGAFARGDNKMELGSEDQSHQWKGDVGSESKRGGSLFNENAMPSPNGRFKPQIGISAQKSDSLSYPQISIPSGEQDIAPGASSDNNHVGRFSQPSVSDDYTQINSSFGNVTGIGIENNATPLANAHVSSNILPGLSIHRTDENGQCISGLSASGQSQTYPIYPNVGEGVQMSQSHDAKPRDVVYVGNASLLQTNAGTASLGGTNALSEQLAQFSQLSTTLAHLLEKRQHLIPQQSGTNDCTSNLPRNTAVPLVPPPASAANLPSQGGGPMRLYDPVCDSLESKPSQSVEQTNSRLGTAEIPSSTSMLPLFAPGAPIVACSDNGLGEKIKDLSEEVNVIVPEGLNNGVEERNEEQDNGPHDDADVEDGDGDGEKKPKDSKVMRAFKFALAEFVKELLKPTWKDGQVSKEVYKTIVKKVVDKVTDTLQADNVPRTKEKINHYLSFSKPKLSKLVQAYLEKYQKA